MFCAACDQNQATTRSTSCADVDARSGLGIVGTFAEDADIAEFNKKKKKIMAKEDRFDTIIDEAEEAAATERWNSRKRRGVGSSALKDARLRVAKKKKAKEAKEAKKKKAKEAKEAKEAKQKKAKEANKVVLP